MTNEEKMKELLQNDEFMAKLSAIEEKSEVQKLFKDNGVELTDEHIEKLKSELESDELDANALDAVSGGLYDARGRKRTWGQFFAYITTAMFFGQKAANKLNDSWG